MSDDRHRPAPEGVPDTPDPAGPAEPGAHATRDPGAQGDTAIDRPTASFGKALSWSYVLTTSRVAITLVISLVLARILGPEAFGLVAMGLAFVAFVELLVRQGMMPAIVQRPGLTPSHLDAAFWMTLGAAFVLTPIVLALSGWWAAVNDAPELGPLLRWLSILIVLKGLSVVQEAQIIRSLNFRVLAIRTSSATFVGGAAGIAAAVMGAGVWALVIQQLVTASLETALIWTMSEWRPRLRFQRNRAAELLGFSGTTALATLAVYLQKQADALLIGLFFGPLVTGLYRMAARLVGLGLEVASGALRSTFLPELSRFQDDREAFLDRTVEILRLSALLAIPLLGGLAAVSAPLLGLLGEDWLPAVHAVQLMAMLAALHSIAIFTGPILQADGQPGAFAWLTWVTGLLSVATLVGAGLLIPTTEAERTVTLLAAARTVVLGTGFVVIVVPVLSRRVGLSPRRLLGAVLPAMLAAAAGFAAVFAARDHGLPPWPQQPLLDLLASGGLAVVTMAGTLLVIEPKTREYWALARTKLSASKSPLN
ncbi:MAG: lipopolysaccharide biosynthesis protein [Nitriliruptor sp.]|nr:MAG: lipopolysaccharide biosynthesis protein [Nitriliruptor sp.]